MEIKTAKRLERIEEYFFWKKLQEVKELNDKGRDIINLAIGNPDLPPPGFVIEKLRNISARYNTHGYQSYRGIDELREAMSSWYKKIYGVDIDPENEILPLIGSKEGIFHISMAFINPGDHVLVPDPGYPFYSSCALIAGGEPVTYNLKEENGWIPDLDEIKLMDLEKVKIMWINYPHMPSGAKIERKEFEELIVFSKQHGILLCHDNPYSMLLNDQHPLSIHFEKIDQENVLELNSLSKSYNMAGWRVGMLAGKGSLLKNILKVKTHLDSGMFMPIQMAAVDALLYSDEWLEDLNGIYDQRRKLVFELLDLIECSYREDHSGLFIWAKLPEFFNDEFKFIDNLLYDGRVFFAPGSIFGKNGYGYIRVSLCARESAIKDAYERVKKFMKNKRTWVTHH